MLIFLFLVGQEPLRFVCKNTEITTARFGGFFVYGAIIRSANGTVTFQTETLPLARVYGVTSCNPTIQPVAMYEWTPWGAGVIPRGEFGSTIQPFFFRVFPWLIGF